MDTIRTHIEVGGIVQGVGFRPFVHKQIEALGITGWIRNTSSGAELEIEGNRAAVEQFVQALAHEKPKLARIEFIRTEERRPLIGYTDFRIIGSHSDAQRNALVSPDVCICPDCLRELFDVDDRRYRFPFVNCTNCGPRFTIIRDVPYDREKTTMSVFSMCPECLKEYTDIDDRRYHAQPDCCPDCGPELFFADADGRRVEGDAIRIAQEYLQSGRIVAVKGLGGFHLACRADLPEAVALLRKRKHRDEKPFAVMCADLAQVENYCEISDAERDALTGEQRPIVLLRRKSENSLPGVSENDRVGVMLPYTPVHYLLLHDGPGTLVMTSANLSDQPIIYKNDEALHALRGIADGFLLHNREIHVRCDDSLMWIFRGEPYFARRSRGYVPEPIFVASADRRILACGAEQKATFSLSKNGRIFPAQHIGDLKNLETYENYQQQIAHFEKLFDIKPEMIVCDQHPDYLSTAYACERAEKESIPLLRVQHHFAHMVACMTDNALTQPCIGIVWDGTGYGDDGSIWGGEFFTGDASGYVRRGSIRPVILPGGDRAVKEIWRIGCAMLSEIGEAGGFTPEQTALVEKMQRLGVNCPKSSGMGRLFDGISAILGIRENVSYEGQGAVLLEALAGKTDECFAVSIKKENDLWIFDHREMTRELLDAYKAGEKRELLAAKFMNTLVEMACGMCLHIREETGLDSVVLSGGSFQNMYMLTRLMQRLEENGFRAYSHRRVSTNDEGISLGQTMIARSVMERETPKHAE